MYQTSQQYFAPQPNYQASSSYSPLETIAHSAIEYVSSTAQSVGNYITNTFSKATSYLSNILGINSIVQLYHNQKIQSNHYLIESSKFDYNSLFQSQQDYNFIPDNFIKPGFQGAFINESEKIKHYITEAFEKLTNQPFPKDINIRILNKEQFQKIAPNPGTVGLAFNRKKYNFLSEIFILNDNLARVMLTIGHEIGHVLTNQLDNPKDEEAKAYAFSLAWMRVIKKHNIAGLKDAITTERPANNGLHNVAFSFVCKFLDQGIKAWDIYQNLINKLITTKDLNYS